MSSPWLKPSLLALALLLAGCASAPPPREPGAAAAWLGGSPRVVVRLDTAQVTAWGKLTSSKEALKAVGDRTRTVWLGFELNNLDDIKTAADTVHIVLEGDFPKGAASFLLDWNSAWKKEAQPGVWTNQPLGLSVSLPEDNLLVVRRNDTALPQTAAGVLRDLNPAALQGAAVWASFWSPGEALFGALGAKLLPVSRLDLVLAAQGEYLEGPLVLHFADERAAQVASVLLKLLSAQIKARLGQELTWNAEGSDVVGTTLRLKQDELQALAEKLVATPEVTP